MAITSGISEPTADFADSISTKKPLSFGEQLVGITFHPSNDGDVNTIKTKMAEVANLINDQYHRQETSPLSKLVFEGAIHDILNAQMNAVKYVTLKY